MRGACGGDATRARHVSRLYCEQEVELRPPLPIESQYVGLLMRAGAADGEEPVAKLGVNYLMKQAPSVEGEGRTQGVAGGGGAPGDSRGDEGGRAAANLSRGLLPAALQSGGAVRGRRAAREVHGGRRALAVVRAGPAGAAQLRRGRRGANADRNVDVRGGAHRCALPAVADGRNPLSGHSAAWRICVRRKRAILRAGLLGHAAAVRRGEA